MVVALLSTDPLGILRANYRPGFLDLEDFLMFAEPLAIIAATVYAVERLIRRCGSRRRISLKEGLIALAVACLIIAVIAQQYRLAQRIDESYDEAAKHGIIVCYAYPPLVVEPWFLRLPLWFGVACGAYAVVRTALWGAWLTVWWMTLNWERADGCNGSENAGE